MSKTKRHETSRSWLRKMKRGDMCAAMLAGIYVPEIKSKSPTTTPSTTRRKKDSGEGGD